MNGRDFMTGFVPVLAMVMIIGFKKTVAQTKSKECGFGQSCHVCRDLFHLDLEAFPVPADWQYLLYRCVFCISRSCLAPCESPPPKKRKKNAFWRAKVAGAISGFTMVWRLSWPLVDLLLLVHPAKPHQPLAVLYRLPGDPGERSARTGDYDDHPEYFGANLWIIRRRRSFTERLPFLLWTSQPSATSKIIITRKPSMTPAVPGWECSPRCASGISSSTTT